MSHFVVHLSDGFQRDLDRIPRFAEAKVLSALKRLETNPYGPPPKIKKLRNKGIGQWRLEVWPYRVRYDIVGYDVKLYRVRHRKEIYRD